MVVTLKEGRPLVCVACMLMIFLSLVLHDFLEKFKSKVKASFKIGHEDVNDLMFTGQRVKWQT